MKQDDKQYEEWLKEVRNRQPVLGNPHELTASIMQRVARMPKRKKRRSLLAGSWLSGVAAALLLCLLVGEALHTPMPDGGRAGEGCLSCTPAAMNHLRQKSTACALPQEWEKMNLADKGEYLSLQYIQPRQMRRQRVMELIRKTD